MGLGHVPIVSVSPEGRTARGPSVKVPLDVPLPEGVGRGGLPHGFLGSGRAGDHEQGGLGKTLSPG